MLATTSTDSGGCGLKSVTSSRSSISSTMTFTSSWLVAIADVIFCSSTVLPVLGAATIKTLPESERATRSITRVKWIRSGLEHDPILGMQRRHVLEDGQVGDLLGIFVDRIDANSAK